PAYPCQRERYWYDEPAPRRSAASRRAAGHPLIGRAVPSAAEPGTHLWHAEVSSDDLGLGSDQSSGGSVSAPAPLIVEAILAGAREVSGTDPIVLDDLRFGRPLQLERDAATAVQMVMSPDGAERVSVQFFSSTGQPGTTSRAWTRHAAGAMDGRAPRSNEPADSVDLGALRARCTEAAGAHAPIDALWRADGELLARLTSTTDATGTAPVSSALIGIALDLLSDSLFGGLVGARQSASYELVEMARVRLNPMADASTIRWGHAVRAGEHDGVLASGDVRLLDDEGRVVLEMTGVRLRRDLDAALRDAFFQIDWEPQPRVSAAARPGGAIWVIVCDRSHIAEQLANSLERQGDRCIRVVTGSSFE